MNDCVREMTRAEKAKFIMAILERGGYNMRQWERDYLKSVLQEKIEWRKKMMSRPEKLDTWFYMAMKEMRRNSYMDLIESWDISEKEANEVENYIEEKLDVRL